ncbi:hypothetical protein EXS65_04760 [Candidatus Peribacteria bacterium]|nr:hypothetical protein [Candidatus Peribacteria bacterium]
MSMPSSTPPPSGLSRIMLVTAVALVVIAIIVVNQKFSIFQVDLPLQGDLTSSVSGVLTSSVSGDTPILEKPKPPRDCPYTPTPLLILKDEWRTVTLSSCPSDYDDKLEAQVKKICDTHAKTVACDLPCVKLITKVTDVPKPVPGVPFCDPKTNRAFYHYKCEIEYECNKP